MQLVTVRLDIIAKRFFVSFLKLIFKTIVTFIENVWVTAHLDSPKSSDSFR